MNLSCLCFIKYLHILKREDTAAEKYKITAVLLVMVWIHIVPKTLQLMTHIYPNNITGYMNFLSEHDK